MNSEYIQRKINAIQAKHNFSPKLKAVHIRGCSERIQRDFGKLQLLREIVRDFNLDVTITYKKDRVKIAPIDKFLYFAQEGVSSIWKFGVSSNPNQRKGALQTGNSNVLFNRYVLDPNDANPDMVEVEKVLKRALRNIKTRDKKSSQKGEWIEAPSGFVKKLVSFIKENHADYEAIHALVKEACLNREQDKVK